MKSTIARSTSRIAIAAAAGLFMGGMALTPAQAADLGGDCCADLEERVAELEATTVRKGNRKVSVKLSGQVNYMLMYWDDGSDSGVYIVDNIESSTRFRFTGAAKFKPGWSAGFLIEVEMIGANGSAVSQKIDGGPGFDNSDLALGGRKAAWYIKSDRLGEVWLGRYSPATDDIQLLNVAGVPSTSAGFFNFGGFFLRSSAGVGGCAGTGCLLSTTLGNLTPSDDTRRGEIIRYNTPSLAGFVLSLSWGEDDMADVAIRYKKEWNSIRVVGGVGYHTDTDEDNDLVLYNSPCPDAVQPGNSGFAAGRGPCVQEKFKRNRWAGSFSAMHTPSGVYGYFGFTRDSFDGTQRLVTNPIIQKDDDRGHWYLQLGVKRRMGWLSDHGATTFYGEYAEWDGALEQQTAGAFTAPYLPVGGSGAAVITDTGANVYGFGLVQDIDKAAMKLWIAASHWDPEYKFAELAFAPGTAGNSIVGPQQSLRLEDYWFVHFGGRINF